MNAVKLSINSNLIYVKRDSMVLITFLDSDDDRLLKLKNHYATWWLLFVSSGDLEKTFSEMGQNHGLDIVKELEALVSFLLIHKYVSLDAGDFSLRDDNSLLRDSDFIIQSWTEYSPEINSQIVNIPIFAQYGGG